VPDDLFAEREYVAYIKDGVRKLLVEDARFNVAGELRGRQIASDVRF